MQKKQIVIPFYRLPIRILEKPDVAKRMKTLGWREFSYRGKPAGFWSPAWGSSRHTAVVEATLYKNGKVKKIENFLYDQFERADGPLKSPYAHATPNAMVVVIEEKRDKTLMVHSVTEWRPFIYDHKKNKKGINVIGVTGKWTQKVGDNPAKTALEGIASDMGIEIEKATFKELGIHTPNRAWSETCNVVYIAKFKRKIPRIGGRSDHDIVMPDGAFPLSDFPIGPDALVNSVLWMVAKHFGCISSKPIKKIKKTKSD